jgi:hypothetical protein
VPAPERPRALLLLLPSVGAGTSRHTVWLSGALGASLRLHRWLRATLDVGYGGGPSGSAAHVDVALQYLPIRAGLAAAPRRFAVEARLNVLAAPYWVRGGAPPSLRASGALAALGASALFFVPRRRRVQAVMGAGLDVYLNREQFLVHGSAALATERVAFWAAAGLAVAVSP